jgi:hypothetical protein
VDNNIITKKRPLLSLRFKGSAIHDGRILYDDLSTFVSNISSAIDRIILAIQTGESVKKGRPLKTRQVLSALEIVRVRKASFGIALDLRRNGQQFLGWDMGEQAVDILMTGLKAIRSDGMLPKEYSPSVMISLRDAGRIIERGVEHISLNSTSVLGNKRAVYTLPVRERIIAQLHKLEHGYAIIEGRLLMLDVEEDKLICKIRPSTGEPILCKYDEDFADEIIKNIRQFVRVKGEATYDTTSGRIASLQVKDLEPIDEATSIGGTIVPISSFWKGKSFDELAILQGVYPISDFDKLSKDWPEDTDFNSFFEAVKGARD